MNTYLLIAVGSALGGMARHWVGLAVAERFGASFPWGTLLVNVTGSFLIGCVAALTDDRQQTQGAREFLMIGVLGGYTTFSAFSLQSLSLLRDGRLSAAGSYIAASCVLCLLAVWLGYLLGRALKPGASG